MLRTCARPGTWRRKAAQTIRSCQQFPCAFSLLTAAANMGAQWLPWQSRGPLAANPQCQRCHKTPSGKSGQIYSIYIYIYIHTYIRTDGHQQRRRSCRNDNCQIAFGTSAPDFLSGFTPLAFPKNGFTTRQQWCPPRYTVRYSVVPIASSVGTGGTTRRYCYGHDNVGEAIYK